MGRARSTLTALVLIGAGACSPGGGDGTAPVAPAETGVKGDIVFNRVAGGELALFAIERDGSGEKRIRALEDFVTLSPDGSRFLGAVPAEDGRIAPETFEVDGSDHVVLSIADPTLQLGDVRWSPDGERILAQGWDDTDPSRTGLYTVRSADGSDVVRLTEPGDAIDYPVTYAPDGARVLFARDAPPIDHHGSMDLMVVDADGSGLVRLNPRGTSAGLTFGTQAASWSPDGTQVAFVASEGSFQEDPRAVFVAEADGTDVRRITPWDVTLVAQWSPDGAWIAFDSSRSDGPHDLFVVHPDGGQPTRLTSSEDGRFSFGPVWSPDGTELLFVRGQDGFDTTDLWTVHVDGTALNQVTDVPAEYGGYAWWTSSST
jgi:Tol biopolymer transport system component